MEIEKAEDWGLFRFLPHELLETQDVADDYGWVVPDMEVIDAPDAWHPLDLLVALLHDDHGVLRGTLAIDVPDNGRRPGPQQRQLLEKFAAAGRSHRGDDAGAGGARRAGPAGRHRPHHRPQRQRPAGAERDPGGVPGRAGRGLPLPRVVDPDLRRGRPRHRRDLLLRPAARSSCPPTSSSSPSAPPGAGWADQSAVVIAGNHPVPPAPARRRAPLDRRRSSTPSASARCCSSRSAPARECLGNLVLTRARRRRVDRARPPGGPRHRPRPRPGDPQRPHLPARARAGRGAAGPRHLQEPADRDDLPRAEEPADRGHRLPRAARRRPRAEPPRRARRSPP